MDSTTRVLSTIARGEVRLVSLLIAFILYALSMYFFRYGQSNETWIATIALGTPWLLIGMFNRQVILDPIDRQINVHSRFGPWVVKKDPHPFDEFAGMLVRRGTKHDGRGRYLAYLMGERCTASYRAMADWLVQRQKEGYFLERPPGVGDIPSLIGKARSRNADIGPPPLSTPCRQSPGLPVLYSPDSQKEALLGEAKQLAGLLRVPLYEWHVSPPALEEIPIDSAESRTR